jgi:5-hydroxyisourate hydrolase-like protein (transthyretin family)
MFSIIRSGFFLLALLALAIPVEAQVSPAVQTATAAISGHVTHSGQPVPGVSIILEPADSHTARAPLPKTITNEQGTYRLAAVPEGRYLVRPIAPAFILASGPDSDKAGTGMSSGLGLSGFVVTLARGDAVEGIDFALEAGGVITGRVIDDAGRPVVALAVDCQRLNEQGQLIGASSSRFETDDRGIYRIYGLPTGKYQVAVSGWDKSGSKPYLRTFHPGSTDPKRAELVEVTAGVESSGIDIRLGHPQQFFSITGRLIDQDTGKPVSGVTINFNGQNDGRTGFATTGATGMFKIENCVLGSYEIKIATTGGQTQGYYTDPVVIPVSDADVTDLEINAVRGATVSGSVIVVGSKDPTVIGAFAQSAMIATNLQPGVRGSARSAGATVIDPAGRFELTGLRPGRIEIRPATLPQGFTLLRIEYNGSPVRDGLTLSAGERIRGLRVLVVYGAGSIRGEIKVEGGTLPTRMDWLLTIRRLDGDGEVRNEMIDARGRFWLTDLAPGQYEITAEADYVEIPGVTPKPYPGPIKQTVSVGDKSESQVLLVLALGR